MYREEYFKFTDDEWYGNYFLNHRGIKTRLVKVSFLELRLHGDNKEYRVCVWGNDDFGLEKDSTNKDDQYKLFKKILKMNRVNKQPLMDLGFVHA